MRVFPDGVRQVGIVLRYPEVFLPLSEVSESQESPLVCVPRWNRSKESFDHSSIKGTEERQSGHHSLSCISWSIRNSPRLMKDFLTQRLIPELFQSLSTAPMASWPGLGKDACFL